MNMRTTICGRRVAFAFRDDAPELDIDGFGPWGLPEDALYREILLEELPAHEPFCTPAFALGVNKWLDAIAKTWRIIPGETHLGETIVTNTKRGVTLIDISAGVAYRWIGNDMRGSLEFASLEADGTRRQPWDRADDPDMLAEVRGLYEDASGDDE